MITEIGLVAGEIWHHLEKNGITEWNKLKEAISFHPDITMMGLGWLAREGHVIIEPVHDSFNVFLRKSTD